MNITIIGAGTAGLASAILLKRKGHEVAVYDQAPKPGPIGAGILLQPTGQAVLKEMDLLDSMKRLAQPIEALRGLNPSQKTIALLPYPKQAGLGVHRGNLFNLLRHTAEAEGIPLHFHTPLNKLTLESSSYRLPEIQDKAPDLIVLANGPHPELLEQTQIPFSSKVYPWGALWAITHTQTPSSELRQLYQGTSTFIGLLPAGLHPQTQQTCESFFWSLPITQYETWKNSSLESFKSQVMTLWPECEEAMSQITSKESFLLAKYRDTVLKKYHDRNLVVIGDAAHAMSPQLGQGVSLALIDAMALSENLHDNIEQSLLNYTYERRQHLQLYQFLTRWLTPLYQSDLDLLALFRNTAIQWGMSIPWTRKKILETLSGHLKGFL